MSSPDRLRVIRTEFGSWECPSCGCRNALVRNDDAKTATCDNCHRLSDLPEPLMGVKVVECGEPGCCDGTCPFTYNATSPEVWLDEPEAPDDRHSVMDDEMHVDHPDWPEPLGGA